MSKKMFSAALLLLSVCSVFSQTRPNVILIMTDDQGYGDIAAHGNPDIITPNLDKLHSESLRLTNFHVNALCAPTRAALMTGQYNMRTGVWATIMGRSMLSGDHVTMAEVFRDNGYRTGMFGKWHLGDNWPMYPRFQGFEEVLTFGGGTIGNIADYWRNDLFDDHYLHNGEWEQQEGYCTDIWFGAAMKWINDIKDEPFFAYIPTNAPHSPFKVWPEYVEMYDPPLHREFYGMITRLDEKLGELRDSLVSWGLDENTILIFMTDNGTVAGQGQSSGYEHYNAGMRGRKGSMYDGGHRVPFFIRWPGGNLRTGVDDNHLTAHVDLLPTFISMCGLTPPEGVTFDGIDISNLLTAEQPEWDRTVIVSRNGSYHEPRKWLAATMKGSWRMVRDNELYNIADDPGQQNNIASQNPDIMTELKAVYEKYWEEIEPQRNSLTWIPLGSDEENPSILTGHDWQPDKTAAWQSQARSNKKDVNGWFSVYFIQDGRYNFALRKFPAYLPDSEATDIMSDVSEVRFTLKSKSGPYDLDTTFSVNGEFAEVNIELDLKQDSMILQSWLDIPNNQGAFYVYVTRLTPNTSVKGKARYDISMEETLQRLRELGAGERLQVFNAAGRPIFDSRRHKTGKLGALRHAGVHFVKITTSGKHEMFKLGFHTALK